VGASWAYTEIGPRGLASLKRWIFQDYGKIGDAPDEKSDKMGFLQFRLLEGGIQRRWVSADGPTGGSVITWDKDESFDRMGRLVQTVVYKPGKLRLDEKRRSIGPKWEDRYKQQTVAVALPAAPPIDHIDEWEVVPADEQLIPNRLTFGNVVCHRRTPRSPAGNAQTYCFAPGVGKIFENTQGGDIEILSSYSIPGCRSSTP
jgi:hypothetical protein